jgi:hypothetical protein
VLRLELGADDYVTKPFSMRELAARVRAVLRRAAKVPSEPEVLRAADITLHRTNHLVTVGDERVDLTPSEFDLLAAMMSTPGRTYTRAELLERLQGTTYEGYERTIDVHIRNLRIKIEPEPSDPLNPGRLTNPRRLVPILGPLPVLGALAAAGYYRLAAFRRRLTGFHRCEDVGVTAAPAQIAGQVAADRVIVGVGVLLQ